MPVIMVEHRASRKRPAPPQMNVTITFDTKDSAQRAALMLVIDRVVNLTGSDAQPLPTITQEAAAVPLPPTAPAPAPAPADSPTPEAASAPTPATDKTGLPWDERIHAGTRTLNADGTWRQRRGLNDPALVARVEAELRGQAGAPAEVPPPPFITQEAAAVPLPPTVACAAPISPPVAPSAPETATAPTPAAPSDFASLMSQVTPLLAANKLTREELEQCAQLAGAGTIVGLMTRPDLVPAVSAAIAQLVALR